jgi:c-di-GMP-binding flagellar brake protein YcgR
LDSAGQIFIIQLKLFLPDDQPAISVPLAVVRWAKDGRLGLEFIRSSEEDQVRLKRFVQRHEQEASILELEWQG